MFIGFSVDRCLERLYKAQDILDQHGVIEGRIADYRGRYDELLNRPMSSHEGIGWFGNFMKERMRKDCD